MRTSFLALASALLGLSGASIPSYIGYQAVWSDDFNGAAGSRANSNNWQYTAPPTPSDGEQQQYVTSTSNAHLTGNGALAITPLKVSTGKWTSARLQSVSNFACQAGQRMVVEAQIQMGTNPASQQQGMWPAFWALGSEFRNNSQSWPSCGEWDIYEAINGAPKAYSTLHCDKYPGGICNEPTGLSANYAYNPSGANKFGIIFDRKTYSSTEWQKQTLTWYTNGHVTKQISGATIGNYNVWKTVSESALYFIMNIAVGGPFPGEPNSATTGGNGSAMFIDYVAVYKST